MQQENCTDFSTEQQIEETVSDNSNVDEDCFNEESDAQIIDKADSNDIHLVLYDNGLLTISGNGDYYDTTAKGENDQ